MIKRLSFASLAILLLLIGPSFAVVKVVMPVTGETSCILNSTDQNTAYAVKVTSREVFKTSDGGATWTMTNASLPADIKSVDFVRDGSTDIGYMACDTDEVYRLTDSGATGHEILRYTALLPAVLIVIFAAVFSTRRRQKARTT